MLKRNYRVTAFNWLCMGLLLVLWGCAASITVSPSSTSSASLPETSTTTSTETNSNQTTSVEPTSPKSVTYQASEATHLYFVAHDDSSREQLFIHDLKFSETFQLTSVINKVNSAIENQLEDGRYSLAIKDRLIFNCMDSSSLPHVCVVENGKVTQVTDLGLPTGETIQSITFDGGNIFMMITTAKGTHLLLMDWNLNYKVLFDFETKLVFTSEHMVIINGNPYFSMSDTSSWLPSLFSIDMETGGLIQLNKMPLVDPTLYSLFGMWFVIAQNEAGYNRLMLIDSMNHTLSESFSILGDQSDSLSTFTLPTSASYQYGFAEQDGLAYLSATDSNKLYKLFSINKDLKFNQSYDFDPGEHEYYDWFAPLGNSALASRYDQKAAIYRYHLLDFNDQSSKPVFESYVDSGDSIDKIMNASQLYYTLSNLGEIQTIDKTTNIISSLQDAGSFFYYFCNAQNDDLFCIGRYQSDSSMAIQWIHPDSVTPLKIALKQINSKRGLMPVTLSGPVTGTALSDTSTTTSTTQVSVGTSSATVGLVNSGNADGFWFNANVPCYPSANFSNLKDLNGVVVSSVRNVTQVAWPFTYNGYAAFESSDCSGSPILFLDDGKGGFAEVTQFVSFGWFNEAGFGEANGKMYGVPSTMMVSLSQNPKTLNLQVNMASYIEDQNGTHLSFFLISQSESYFKYQNLDPYDLKNWLTVDKYINAYNDPLWYMDLTPLNTKATMQKKGF